jgi:hypothetical protein
MDIYKIIKLNYGQQVLQQARKLEKTATQLAAWKNHLTFNHRCKRLGVTPPSLRLHTNVRGQAAHQVITAAQKKLTPSGSASATNASDASTPPTDTSPRPLRPFCPPRISLTSSIKSNVRLTPPSSVPETAKGPNSPTF